MEEKPWRESVAFGSRADSKYLADSKESCGFLRDLLIRRNLADYVSSADSKCLLREGLMMIAGFCGLYIRWNVRVYSGLLAAQGEVSRMNPLSDG